MVTNCTVRTNQVSSAVYLTSIKIGWHSSNVAMLHEDTRQLELLFSVERLMLTPISRWSKEGPWDRWCPFHVIAGQTPDSPLKNISSNNKRIWCHAAVFPVSNILRRMNYSETYRIQTRCGSKNTLHCVIVLDYKCGAWWRSSEEQAIQNSLEDSRWIITHVHFNKVEFDFRLLLFFIF